MATPGRDLVLFEPLQNGVGLITLNNPEWLNAYTKRWASSISTSSTA